MSLTTIREQIKTILSGVSGIGVVHDYERWAADWTKFLDLFRVEDDDGKKTINGWMFNRRKTPAKTASTTHDLRTHNFQIQGIYGLKDSDASEIVFQQIIEDACAAFRSKYKLNDTADNTEPVQVELVENRMFGIVLCHYCELTLIAEEYENWS